MKTIENVERRIAKAFYEDGMRKEDLIKMFHLRPKTLNDILARRRDEFVKES